MPVQIANPDVVAKIEHLSRVLGLGKTAVVEQAVDHLLAKLEGGGAAGGDAWERFHAILAQLDRIPDVAQPFDPLQWDERGLPK